MSGVLHGVIASLKTAVASVTDAYWKYVSLLLNTTSTNGAQNNTFLDSSTNAFSVTRNGDTTQGSFNPYMPTGYWSGYFDGTGDYLSVNFSSGSTIAGDFTWETWIYDLGTKSYGTLLGWRTGSVPWAGFVIYRNNSENLVVSISSGTLVITQTSGTYKNNQWNHVALVRSGTTVTLYVNGASAGSGTYSPSFNPGAAYWTASDPYNNVSNAQFAGYISNQRFVNGTAVYTSAFTPPTSPLSAISGTSLLCLQDNRFKDNSTNAFAITVNGDTRISKFAPFNPPASYSTATYGGSGYFDGTGDFLTVPSNAAFAYGTGDFTWECWFYAATNGGYIIEHGSNGGTISFAGTRLAYYNATIGVGSALYTTGFASNPPLNTWYHIAAVRSGGTTSLYFNGTLSVSAADSHNYGNQSVSIGQFGGGGLNFKGYISNLRLVNGTAVYSGATLTVPTSPLTAISGTSLLLNFDNAGIYDAATINDAETEGNAQVSTTQAKFGTTSMYFDGTGDWLPIIDKPELRFGTGAFTVEFWLYLGATGAARGLVAKGTSTTGWLVSTDASDKVVFTYTTSTITSTGALSGSTWYHIAVVREGTGSNQTKIYIDGVNDGTGTVSTDFNQTSVMYVAANRTGGDALNGYIQDLRITNGYARYTGNFTPPTAAFPTL